jgi:hypothetical protein
MTEEFENIDGFFSSELKDFSPTPPAGIWENIESQLPRPNNQKVRWLYIKVAAGIALLLGLAGIGIISLNNQDTTPVISETILPENTTVANKNNNIKSEKSPYENLENANNSNFSAVSEISSQGKSSIEQLLAEVPAKNKTTLITENDVDIIVTQSASEEIPTLIVESKSAEIEATLPNNTIIIKKEKHDFSAEYHAFLKDFEDLNDYPEYSRWQVGGQAGPQYSYRQVTSQYASQEYIDLYNQSETGIIAYAGGVNVAYKPAKRLSIQSGIYYSKYGQNAPAEAVQTWDGIYFSPNTSNMELQGSPPELRVASSLGSVDAPQSENISNGNADEINRIASQLSDVNSVTQYLEFVEIPINARYAIIDRKLTLHVMGGVSTNLLIGSPVYLDNGNYYTNTQDLNTVNYSSTVGMGIGYKFADNFLFSLEPQYKQFLKKVNTDATSEVRPYSFGIFTGLTYSF